jgi:hypothetical protein
VPAGGTLTIDATSALDQIHLVNDGQATITGHNPVYLEDSATLENAGTLTLADASDLVNGGGSGPGQLLNDTGATITYPGGPNGAQIAAALTNSGTITASAGTLTLAGTVSQTSGGTFTGAGTILLTGTVSPSGTGADLAGATVDGEIAGPGTLTVPAGGTLTIDATSALDQIHLVNDGQATITGHNPVYLEDGPQIWA